MKSSRKKSHGKEDGKATLPLTFDQVLEFLDKQDPKDLLGFINLVLYSPNFQHSLYCQLHRYFLWREWVREMGVDKDSELVWSLENQKSKLRSAERGLLTRARERLEPFNGPQCITITRDAHGNGSLELRMPGPVKRGRRKGY